MTMWSTSAFVFTLALVTSAQAATNVTQSPQDANLYRVPNAACVSKPASCFDTCWERCFSCPLRGFAVYYQVIYNMLMRIKSFREVFNAAAIGVALDTTNDYGPLFEYQRALAAMAVLVSTGGVNNQNNRDCDSIFVVPYNASTASYTPSQQCLTPCQAAAAINAINRTNQGNADWLGGACSSAAAAMQNTSLPCSVSASDRVILLAFINSNSQANNAPVNSQCNRFEARASISILYQASLRSMPTPYPTYLKPPFQNLNVTDVYSIYKNYAARGLLNCMRKSCCTSTSSRADDPDLARSKNGGSASSSDYQPVNLVRTNFEKEAKEKAEEHLMEHAWQRGLDFSIDF